MGPRDKPWDDISREVTSVGNLTTVVFLGLVPRTHRAAGYALRFGSDTISDDTYYVYILASGVRGTLYIGVTNSILFRVSQHRDGVGGKFTRTYRVGQLVWYEIHDTIDDAIQREKSLKRYRRDWKCNLIERENPHWIDLYPALLAKYGPPAV